MADKPKAANLAQVAQRCGVGPATVSRVLNGYQRGFSVRPEVRERIVAAAREMEYRPNLSAKMLRSKRTRLVAVLGIHSEWITSAGVTGSIVSGATSVLQRANYDVFACFPRSQTAQYALPPWRVDAAIVISPIENYDFDEIEQANIPYVTVNGKVASQGAGVVVDDASGTRKALDHFYALGHRRIAYVSNKNEHHISETVRHNTYLDWMAQTGLTPVPGHEVLCSSASEFLRTAVHEHGATAVLAYSHLLAVELLAAAVPLGLDVPRDLSLICFNDEYPCQAMHPPLTAVALPSRAMGEQTARMLLEKLRDSKATPRTMTLDETLVVRQSTAEPKAKTDSKREETGGQAPA